MGKPRTERKQIQSTYKRPGTKDLYPDSKWQLLRDAELRRRQLRKPRRPPALRRRPAESRRRRKREPRRPPRRSEDERTASPPQKCLFIVVCLSRYVTVKFHRYLISLRVS